jgi:glycosyltransferase involved in cell wall biosynthesis
MRIRLTSLKGETGRIRSGERCKSRIESTSLMKLLYASNLYPPAMGGAQLHLHCLAKAMRAAGNDATVVAHTCRHRTDWLRLSTVCTEPNRHFKYEGIPVWQLGFSPLTRIRILPWALCYYSLIGPAVRNISHHALDALLSLEPPDIVHAVRNGREFLTRAALDFARLKGTPFALTPVHHPRWDGWRYTEYDRIYRESDALFVLTEAERRMLIEQKGVSEEKIHVTGVGPVLSREYDVDEFRTRFDIRSPFVLFVGQQFRYKGIGALLEAAQLVWRKHSDVDFVFIGPQTNYSKAIFSTARDKRIRNLGEVDLASKTAALACCEFLCLPSSQESFGGVYLEAWSLGKAVIGGRIPAIAELITEGKDGLLSSQDPSELADAISLLLTSPEQCRKMGNAGTRKVETRYTWEQIARKTVQVYDGLIGKKRSMYEEPCETAGSRTS